MPSADMPRNNIDSARIENKPATEQVAQFRGETVHIQADEKGNEYVIIGGKKYLLARQDKVGLGRAEAPRLETSGEIVTPGGRGEGREIASVE